MVGIYNGPGWPGWNVFFVQFRRGEIKNFGLKFHASTSNFFSRHNIWKTCKKKDSCRFFTIILFLTFHHRPQKKIKNFFDNVHLHPIDCFYEDFSNYSLKNHTFYPQHLDLRFPEERKAAREVVSNYM